MDSLKSDSSESNEEELIRVFNRTGQMQTLLTDKHFSVFCRKMFGAVIEMRGATETGIQFRMKPEPIPPTVFEKAVTEIKSNWTCSEKDPIEDIDFTYPVPNGIKIAPGSLKTITDPDYPHYIIFIVPRLNSVNKVVTF